MHDANDSKAMDALRRFSRVADELGMAWILVGARARDNLLARSLGAEPGRKTSDVDVAVEMSDWEQNKRLAHKLEIAAAAKWDPEIPHRFVFEDSAPLDVIPFGGVEEAGTVEWPPPGSARMTVLGFQEALEGSEWVRLGHDLEVRIPRLEHYLCLKFIAWEDRHTAKPHHDAVDIRHVLDHADGLISTEELYEQHAETMKRCAYDSTLACIRILGERLRLSLRRETREALTRILRRETDEDGRLDFLRELDNGVLSLPRLRALLYGLS